MQERMFKDMFESVLSSVNMRIDKVVKSVMKLKASIEYSQQDINDLKEAADAIDTMDKELEDIQRGFHKTRRKILREKLEEKLSMSMEFLKKTTSPGQILKQWLR